MRNYLEFENEVKSLEDELSKLKDPFHKEGISEVDTKSIEKIHKYNHSIHQSRINNY